MVMPVAYQASQYIWAPQENTVCRRRAADHDVIAAARSGVPPIQHEFLSAKPRLSRERVNRLGGLHELVPGSRRMNIHFDHARVRRHSKDSDSWIEWQPVAFQHHRHVEISGGVFDRR